MRETWDKTGRETTQPCARSEDLVAYLYKEATHTEARDFEIHLKACVACNAESAAFGDLREAMGEWRREALGTLSSPAFETEAPLLTSVRGTRAQNRSALGAIRQFFTLSPAWMRAATAAVVLVFCTLAIIAVAYFAEQPKVLVVERPLPTDGVREDGAANDRQAAPPITTPTVTASVNEKPQTPRRIERRTVGAQRLVNKRKQVLPRSLTEAPTELASANDYLPFTVPSAEEKLPSLVDLAEEPN